jgi:hypothetical protein
MRRRILSLGAAGAIALTGLAGVGTSVGLAATQQHVSAAWKRGGGDPGTRMKVWKRGGGDPGTRMKVWKRGGGDPGTRIKVWQRGGGDPGTRMAPAWQRGGGDPGTR